MNATTVTDAAADYQTAYAAAQFAEEQLRLASEAFYEAERARNSAWGKAREARNRLLEIAAGFPLPVHER